MSLWLAACVEEHEHHARALPLVEAVHEGEVEGFISAHSVLEVYAILTRLPRSPWITPFQAAKLIEENIVGHFGVVALTAKEYGSLTHRIGQDHVFGGKAFEALHLECVTKSGAGRIYTFNVRHFTELGSRLAATIAAP